MRNKLICLFVLVALLPTLILRDYTPGNELRYLSIADEALRNGTLFAFTNQGNVYADKPPLYFWLVMLAKTLLGRHAMWMLSLFSLVPAFVIVRTMNRWTRDEIYKEYRSAGSWMLLSCGLFLGVAAFLRPDMLMCMFIVLSLHTFYRMLKEEGNPRRNAILFPVYLFLWLLSKGPIALLVPLLSSVAFLLLTKRIRTIGQYWGWKTWGILLAGCLLWFGGAYAEGGHEYLSNLLFHQTMDRAVNAFHHKEPFYYYALTMWYTFLPWAMLIFGTIFMAWRSRQYHSELEKFFLTVPTVTFLLLSCISSKIQVYLLPAYPFLVYLTVMLLPRLDEQQWPKRCIAFPCLAFCLALPVFILAAQQERMEFLRNGFLYAASGILTVTGFSVLHALFRQRSLKRGITRLAAGLFCALFVGGMAMPELSKRWGYGTVCRKAVEASRTHRFNEFCAYDIHRAENMDIFLQQDVRIVTREELFAEREQGAVLMFPVREIETIRQIIPEERIHRVGYYGYAVWEATETQLPAAERRSYGSE